MKITAELLNKHDACGDQIKAFKIHWPEGCYPTIENMAEAAAIGLSVWWLRWLLPAKGPSSQRVYALWRAHQREYQTNDFWPPAAGGAAWSAVRDARLAALSQLLMEAK